MTDRYAIANIAGLLGEPTRAAILLALLDGRELPAGELAREAKLSNAATSLHLTKLTQGGLLAVRQQGRHRYFRLASAEVAHALEALGAVATPPPSAQSRSAKRAELRAARTCYDHLAGAVSVALAAKLESEQVLRVHDERSYAITTSGARWLSETLEIDVEGLDRSERSLAGRCLDWTERRPHIAGALGAAILLRLTETRWVARTRDSRALQITARGRDGFASLGLPSS